MKNEYLQLLPNVGDHRRDRLVGDRLHWGWARSPRNSRRRGIGGPRVRRRHRHDQWIDRGQQADPGGNAENIGRSCAPRPHPARLLQGSGEDGHAFSSRSTTSATRSSRRLRPARRCPTAPITLLGRGNTCVNTGGEKVFPEEVEAALMSHPDVFDVLVVGVPDERLGQRVPAVSSRPRPGTTPTFDELTAHACATRLPATRCLRRRSGSSTRSSDSRDRQGRLSPPGQRLHHA